MRNLGNRLSRLILPILTVVLAMGLWTLPATATNAFDLPSVQVGDQTWMIDEGEVISRLNEGKISSELEQLAQATGKEVRFVTIHRLDYGDTVETFTEKLFNQWFQTSEAQANQILLVLDTVTNDAAIRTGTEVKSILSDEIAKSVASETVLVPLKQGEKYNQALLDASDRLVAVLSGQPDPGPPMVGDTVQTEGTFATPEETQSSNATVWVLVLLTAATVIPMATYYFFYR